MSKSLVPIIEKELAKIEKRLSVIESIISQSPLSRICDIRMQASKIMEENKGNYEKISKLISPLADEEKECFRIAKLQQGTTLWDEKFQLEQKKYDLNNDMYFAKRRS